MMWFVTYVLSQVDIMEVQIGIELYNLNPLNLFEILEL